METPLAYLVLRAKTGSVDRIPAVPIDLEFNDGSGMVRLPVASQVVLIDARDEHPAPRPCQDMKVRQLWDDRRLASGTAQLEVTATAQGLVPTLDRLVDLGPGAMPGFRVAKVQDQRLEMKSLETAGGQIQPVTERRWTIDVEPDPAARTPPREFVFPAAAGPSIAMEYQRYDDADVVAAGPTVPLRTVLTARQIGLWIGGGIAVAVLLLIGLGTVVYVSSPSSRGDRRADVPPAGSADALQPRRLAQADSGRRSRSRSPRASGIRLGKRSPTWSSATSAARPRRPPPLICRLWSTAG